MTLARTTQPRAPQPVVIVGAEQSNRETIRQLALTVIAGLIVHWIVTPTPKERRR